MVVPILKRIAIGIGLATVLVVAVGLLLPRTWTISRTVVMDAPQARLYALCDDLQEWPAWTPWFRADPDLQVDLGPVTRGVGAHQSWHGETGGGDLTVTRSDPAWGVAYDIDFASRHTRAHSIMHWAPADSGKLAVTWDMTGDSGWNVMDRYLGLLMDPMLGPMFDDGLERLKLVAEGKVPAVSDSLRAVGDSLGTSADSAAAGQDD